MGCRFRWTRHSDPLMLCFTDFLFFEDSVKYVRCILILPSFVRNTLELRMFASLCHCMMHLAIAVRLASRSRAYRMLWRSGEATDMPLTMDGELKDNRQGGDRAVASCWLFMWSRVHGRSGRFVAATNEGWRVRLGLHAELEFAGCREEANLDGERKNDMDCWITIHRELGTREIISGPVDRDLCHSFQIRPQTKATWHIE